MQAKSIVVPEITSFDEARQAIAKAVTDLQTSVLSQLPVTNMQGQRISNVGPPVSADDVVTLKYLQSNTPPQLQPTSVTGTGASSISLFGTFWTQTASNLYPNNTAWQVLVSLTGTDVGASSIVAGLSINVVNAASNAQLVGMFCSGGRAGFFSGVSGTQSTYFPMTFDTSGTERMRILTQGQLLIGISSTDLSLLNGAVVNNDSFNCVSATTNTSVMGMAIVAGSYGALYSSKTGTGTNLPMAFFTAQTERMRIDTSGNVMIGSTTAASSLFAGLDDNFKVASSGASVSTFCELISDGSSTANAQWNLVNFGHGSNTNGGYFRGMSCGGTLASPAATISGSQLCTVSGGGYTNAALQEGGVIRIVSNSLWSATNAETYMAFFVTAHNSVSTAEAMRINPSGELLVGLTQTDVTSSSIVAGFSINVVSATTNASIIGMFVTAGVRAGFYSGRSTVSGTYLDMTFDTSGSERMRITTLGITLFGTPSTDLSLNTGAVVSMDTFNCINASINTSVCGMFCVSGVRAGLYSSRSGSGAFLPMVFDTNLSERMRILVNGKVLINRTTDDGTGAQLQVNGSISSNGTLITVP